MSTTSDPWADAWDDWDTQVDPRAKAAWGDRETIQAIESMAAVDAVTPLWLQGLNPDQAQVATHVLGPAVVIAGAGSGKTKSVVARITNLIRSCSVGANEILGITFTRKAAKEMRDRVFASLREGEGKGLELRTFHSLGVKLCRAHALDLGLRERFSVWDEKAQLRQMKGVIAEVREESRQPALERSYSEAHAIGLLSKWKEAGLQIDHAFWSQLGGKGKESGWFMAFASEEQGASTAKEIQEKSYAGGYGDAYVEANLRELGACIQRYEQLKRLVGAADLDDLIWLPVTKSRENARLAEAIGKRWRYVIVDEYQDTNELQEQMIVLLAGQNKNVMVVGDDDQSIYGWRGGKVDLIVSFQERWKAKIIRLGQNYRCRKNIVLAAESSVSINEERVPKRLWSERDGEGLVELHVFANDMDETNGVVAKVEQMLSGGTRESEIAILTRKRMDLRIIAKALRTAKIRCEAIGVKPWWEHEAVRMVLNVLRVEMNPTDTDAAEDLLSNWPLVGVTTIEAWKKILKEEGIKNVVVDPIKKILTLPRSGPGTKKGQSLTRLVQCMTEVKACVAARNLLEACQRVLKHTGVADAMKAAEELGVANTEQTEEAEETKICLDALFSCIGDIEQEEDQTVEGLIDAISVNLTAERETREKVVVSTIHGSKGLEWDKVILVRLTEGVIPNPYAPIEEERRLFYVGCTRAKEELHMTSSRARWVPGVGHMTTGPSPFVEEAERSGVIQRRGR